MIRFTQRHVFLSKTEEVDALNKTFETFEDVRRWVARDKVEGYGDVLAYDGTFEGLTDEQVAELKEMSYEDAILIIGENN